MEIDIKEYETQLTSRGFFAAFEKVYSKSKSAQDAYDIVVARCVEKNLSVKYSTFESFQNNYYRFLAKQRKKYPPMVSKQV